MLLSDLCLVLRLFCFCLFFVLCWFVRALSAFTHSSRLTTLPGLSCDRLFCPSSPADPPDFLTPETGGSPTPAVASPAVPAPVCRRSLPAAAKRQQTCWTISVRPGCAVHERVVPCTRAQCGVTQCVCPLISSASCELSLDVSGRVFVWVILRKARFVFVYLVVTCMMCHLARNAASVAGISHDRGLR